MSGLVRAQYKSSPPTFDDTQDVPLQADANGNLKTVSGATGASANQVQGNVASGATDAGNPVKAGGVYTATQPTLTDGQRGNLTLDARSGLLVVLKGRNGNTSPDVGNYGDGEATLNTLAVQSQNSVFNGATWDRMRGDAANGTVVQDAGAEYETVAASQTDQMLGAAGAVGDYLRGLLVIPATTSPGEVSIEDGATNMIVFAGGASSVNELRPIWIPLGIKSVSGGWEVTTGANVSVLACGNFT